MGRLLVSLDLLVKTTLFLHTGQGGALLLGLGLLSECALLGGCQTIIGIFAPVGEVTITLHVALGQTEDLQGLQEELLL
jgi:hypothetical protein